jgi:hypothetical protein
MIRIAMAALRAAEGHRSNPSGTLSRRIGGGHAVLRSPARFIVLRGRVLRRHLGRDRTLRRRFFGFGALSGLLYMLLFLYAREVLAASSRTDGLFFLVPIAIALVFSFVHGAFTGYFWQALGVRGVRTETGK